MRAVAVLAVVGMTIGMVGVAHAQPYVYVKGNDTGGIIAWSCEAELMAPRIAAEHCAWHRKHHRITSVHRQDGDYISFQCLWDRRKAPYAIPAVRTRTAACPPYRDAPYLSARD